MDLRAYAKLLARRWTVFAIALIVVFAGVGGASFLIPPTYEATAQVFLTVTTTLPDATLSDRRNATLGVQDQIKTYAQLATTQAVLTPVIADLGLDTSVQELARLISVEVPTDTTVLKVTATSDTAKLAASIANDVAKQLPAAIAELDGSDSGASTIVAQTMQPALPPDGKASPNLKLNLALAFVLGLFAGVAAAVIVDNFDNRIRRGVQFEAIGVRFFGGIPIVRDLSARQMLEYGKRQHASFTAYRRIAIDLLFAAGAAPTTLLLTSARSGSGKTTVGSNIASALAEAGNKVLYIDADVRGGRLAPAARVPQVRGISDVIGGRIESDAATFFWQTGNFTIMPAGGTAIDPVEMLSGDRMRQLLDELSAQFDVIIVDAPPVVGASDAALLTQNLKHVLVVVEAGATKRAELARVATAFARVDVPLLGAVLTRSSSADASAGALSAEPLAEVDT